MIAKRIIGFVLLGTFIGFMGYKLNDSLRGSQYKGITFYLVFVVLLILILAIRRLLND